MENDNNHINEKATYAPVDTVVKKNDQWSEHGSEGYPYEDDISGGSNPEISQHYEEIPADHHHVRTMSTSYPSHQYHDIQVTQHDVGSLMPVTSVYSVTPDHHAHQDYSHSMPSPIVTTMVSAIPIGHETEQAPQAVQVHFEEGYAAPAQVKVLCNPEQQISDMNHHREQQQQQQQQQQRDEQHENVHEKNQETEEMNSTPTAHPDLNSLQQLAATQDPLVQNGIRVELQGKALWRTFYEIGTEMIITKVGRRMFPAIRIKVSGLKPQKKYAMLLDIEAVDDNRYRYVYHSSKWMVAGTADNPVPPRVYVHPESPATGENWMRQVVSFDKLKLTNHENDTQGHMILHSMHKYQPRVHVIEILDEANPPTFVGNQRVDINQPGITTFIFRETQFITVTAYQNQQITRLKIDRNPFAKGFRNSGRNKPTHYDSNAPPMAGTYAAWRSSNLAAAAHSNSNSKSTIQEFEHQSPPVTGWSNPIHHHHTFQTHSSLQPKYTGQPTYPSINNLSPSSINSSNLGYSSEGRTEQVLQPYAYSPYSVPCNLNSRQDPKVEVMNVTPLIVGTQRQNHKRPHGSATHEDHYVKEPRYDEDYVTPDSPSHIQAEIHPHHLHHYNQYN